MVYGHEGSQSVGKWQAKAELGLVGRLILVKLSLVLVRL